MSEPQANKEQMLKDHLDKVDYLKRGGVSKEELAARVRMHERTQACLADPGHQIRCQILDMLKPFHEQDDKELLAKTLHLPFWAETLLRAHSLYQYGESMFGSHVQPIRPPMVLGLAVVYDALYLSVVDKDGHTREYYQAAEARE